MDYASSAEANPSSIHSFGVKAKAELQNARKDVAKVLNAHMDEIIFTSGGTESNNLAIQGVLRAVKEKLPHIITTNIEHPSVLETFKLMEKRELAEISIVPVEINGIVDPKKIKKEIKKNTVLVSVMYVNNEIGTIQPIREIAKEIRHWKKKRSRSQVSKTSPFPVFHTDAVQAVNYLDLNVEALGVDLLSLSGSKIEGAGRVGVLYKRRGTQIENIFGGGGQEFGLRPGTENLPEIIKFSEALELVQKIKEKEVKRLTKLRDYFIAKLSKMPFDIKLNGDLENRLPNNVNISIPNIPSDLLVIELSARGIMASEKSACESGDGKASYVIKAIRPEIKPARNAFSIADAGGENDGSLRFSMGRQTTKKDIDYTLKSLSEILTKLKKWYTPTPI
ncbi:MAG: Cysteine desulfurase [Parcubacteria group bacterium GW2011_GWC1_35_8]|nr:MAG: Cysteine desulfurase [Parcubacteria group bacterium GW2011_GWC1_35_8]